jgi:hypothetical protein
MIKIHTLKVNDYFYNKLKVSVKFIQKLNYFA